MAKGPKPGTREAKKPKKAKAPAPVPISRSQAPMKGAAFIPAKPK